MKIIKPQRLGLLTRNFEFERRYFVGISILALHSFSRALASEVDMWKFLPAELGPDGIPDTGMPKSRAEFLVTGSAFATEEAPRQPREVRVQLGALDKALSVFGDRYWRPGHVTDMASDPEPFEKMPMTWENAFGGEGFQWNPLGKGLAPVTKNDQKIHPLPNIEIPGKHVAWKRDRPQPAGFGPIDIMWPQRSAKAGTHDEKWLARHFPGFATDMDWSIFNIAPEDQQQREQFLGDEEFVIEGMHPSKPRLTGQLPGMATRCFVNQQTTNGELFCEVAMGLTTVWLFPHAEKYLLLFHGTHEVAEDDAADLLDILIGAEDLGKPRAISHYSNVRELRFDPDKGSIHSLCDKDLLPSSPEINSVDDEAMAEMNALIASDGLLNRNQRRRLDKNREEMRADIEARGLDPDVYGPAPFPPDEPIPSLEELAEINDQSESMLDGRKAEVDAQKAKWETELRDSLVEQGLDADEVLARSKKPMTGPPLFFAEREIENLRALSPESVAEHRQRLEEAEKNIREGYRQTAHFQDTPPRLEGEEATLARNRFLRSIQAGSGIAHVDFTGIDLAGIDLRGADLRKAWLENANLAGANLEGADLSEAVLARADLTDTNLSNANLTGANLGLAQITRTIGENAVLTEAIMGKARFDGANFRAAKFDSADLMEAGFKATDMSGAELAEVTFHKDDLKGICFVNANLSKCNFIEVDVSGVDFSGARLDKANFIESTGVGAVFTGAQLVNTCFVKKCVFDKADFRQAVLDSACLRGTSLTECDFSEARLAESDFSECNLEKANMFHAFARNALFIKTRLVGAILGNADLMNAILLNADLSGADLGGANLYAADLARIHKDGETNFEFANTKKARTVPERTSL